MSDETKKKEVPKPATQAPQEQPQPKIVVAPKNPGTVEFAASKDSRVIVVTDKDTLKK